MRNYLNIIDTEYATILTEILKEEEKTILQVPGVFELISEYFNNKVLKRYKYGGNKGEWFKNWHYR